MAVYDLEEQEKLDDLKAWWEQNSKYVSAAVVVVALVVIGVQGWRWWSGKRAADSLKYCCTSVITKSPLACCWFPLL